MKYFGMGLPDGYLEQMIAKVNHLMQHGPIESKAGEVGRASVEDTKMELGVGTQFFVLSYKQWGRLTTETWATSLWKEVAPLPISITLHEVAVLPLQREHDEYLMERIMAVGGFGGEDIEGINCTRISAQVYSLADVVTGDGVRIQRKYLNGRDEPEPSKLTWPDVRPTKRVRALFVMALQQITSSNGMLQTRLGDWLRPTHWANDTRYDRDGDRIYCRQHGQWGVYAPSEGAGTRSGRTYSRVQMVASILAGTRRATVTWTARGESIVEGHAPVRCCDVPRPMTLREIFESWGEEWVWRNVEIDDEGEWLAEAISQGTVILVCDGSFKPRESRKLGAAAWILECQATG